MNDLEMVLSELDQISDFYQLGLGLGLRPSMLDRIEQNSFKVESRLRDVVKTWLNRGYMVDRYGPPTWESVCKAVEKLNPALAMSIERRRRKQ